MEDEAALKKPPIVFNLDPVERPLSVLEEERQKHEERAIKFGVQFMEPSKSRRDLFFEAKKERLSRPGFTTGFDLFSEVRHDAI